MFHQNDTVTFTLPRSLIDGILTLPPDMIDRMHHLLERNTDGALNRSEKAEVESLVQIAHLSQLLSLAIAAGSHPSV